MPTAARAIRLAFGFVGRYSGTTGLCGEIDAMRCDAMQCVEIKVRTVPYRVVPRLSAPDRGQISITGLQWQPTTETRAHRPYPGCGGREPSQLCKSLSGTWGGRLC